jgi:hypothetical protein
MYLQYSCNVGVFMFQKIYYYYYYYQYLGVVTQDPDELRQSEKGIERKNEKERERQIKTDKDRQRKKER